MTKIEVKEIPASPTETDTKGFQLLATQDETKAAPSSSHPKVLPAKKSLKSPKKSLKSPKEKEGPVSSPNPEANKNNSSNQALSPPYAGRQSSISATFQYESDFSDILQSPPKKGGKPFKKPLLLRSRKVSADQSANRKVMSPENSAAPQVGHNKVAPLDSPGPSSPPERAARSPPPSFSASQVPPENRVVCTADIHREKSPSLNSSVVSGINSPRD